MVAEGSSRRAGAIRWGGWDQFEVRTGWARLAIWINKKMVWFAHFIHYVEENYSIGGPSEILHGP